MSLGARTAVAVFALFVLKAAIWPHINSIRNYDSGTSSITSAFSMTTLPLWPNGPPDDIGISKDEVKSPGTCTQHVSHATLTSFLPPPEAATGMAIVLVPGGGYSSVCEDSEGAKIALEFLIPQGIAAFVVKYRLPNQKHHTIPAQDVSRAIRTVRFRAKEWKIDPTKIGLWGFSAGGHVASTVSTAVLGDDDFIVRSSSYLVDEIDELQQGSSSNSRPDFAILFYPVISMEAGVTHPGSRQELLGDTPTEELVARYSNEQHVTQKTPPTFLLHAADDSKVPVENSLRYYQQLLHATANNDKKSKASNKSRLLVYETGEHGPNCFRSNPSWLPVFLEWIAKQ